VSNAAGPSRVLVPKTSVYKDNLPARHERKIGFSRQVGAMKSKAITHRVHHPAHLHLGLHVLTSDAPHVL
jgi:hypothetical protein